MSQPDTIASLGIKNCLQIIETGVRWVVLCLSQDGACTESFENFRDNSLKGDLSNDITLNPPLFSLVNTFNGWNLPHISQNLVLFLLLLGSGWYCGATEKTKRSWSFQTFTKVDFFLSFLFFYIFVKEKSRYFLFFFFLHMHWPIYFWGLRKERCCWLYKFLEGPSD